MHRLVACNRVFGLTHKSEGYYKKSPNIYDRLGREEGILIARKNAIPFSLEEAKSKGISEMNKFFDFFEK